VVPIINENDTIVTDEIKFGDNDTLGALVANLVEADVLIILTDQQGLYTADPRTGPGATLISEGRAEDRAYEAMAGGAGSGISKRRHDHQDPGRPAGGPQRRAHLHRQRHASRTR
jgi:glutamate 5-kinase